MPQIFDRKKLHLDKQRAFGLNEGEDFLFQKSASILYERLMLLNIWNNKSINNKPHKPPGEKIKVLEVGAKHGILTHYLMKHFTDLIVTDTATNLLARNPCQNQIIVDDEELEFENLSYDLIVSSLNLHWINNIHEFLKKIYCALRQNGYFLASFIAGGSLKSLRKLFIELELSLGLPCAPHISPFIKQEDITHLMQISGFSSCITDSEIFEIHYSNVKKLLYDLKNMGESNKLINQYGKPLSKKLYYNLMDCERNKNFITEFEIIIVTGKKL